MTNTEAQDFTSEMVNKILDFMRDDSTDFEEKKKFNMNIGIAAVASWREYLARYHEYEKGFSDEVKKVIII